MRSLRGTSQAPPPNSVEQAVARSLQHARNSGAEALLAARALMDALSILLANEPVVRHADPTSPIAQVAAAMENWARTLGGVDSDPATAGLRSVFEALDSEILRWEQRAPDDPDARAVLGAFLGMREILREFNPDTPGQAFPPRAAFDVGRRQPSSRRRQPSSRRSGASKA